MMFGKRLSLFKLFGFEVRLDLSWLILAVLITWTLAQGVFPHYYKDFSGATYWLMGAAGALGLFISIVFHEFWHSMVARRNGLPMKGITLFIFGGVAEMGDEPPNPNAEFKMAIAGPVSSIVLGLGLYGVFFLGKSMGWSYSFNAVINYLGFINLLLAGFNLVPAFPLDGGRVLRSLLWKWKNNLRWATRIASNIGSGFGIFLIVMGVFSVMGGNFIGGIWWFLIGMFLKGASETSYQQLLIRKGLEGEKVRRFMNSELVTVPPDISVEELVDGYIYKHHYKMYPVQEDGRLIGCVTINQIKEIPENERKKKKVIDLAGDCTRQNTISPDEDAMKALSKMNQYKTSRLMVVEEGRLIGMIALKDMMKLLSLKVDLKENL
jgi:Zn-dependent protease/predicted transcriptional regulator